MTASPSSLRRSTTVLSAATVLSLLGSVVSTPVLYGSLTRREFGTWALVYGVASTLALFDLGLTAVVIRFSAFHHSRGDLGALRAVVRWSSRYFLGLSCAVVLVAVGAHGPLRSALGSDEHPASERVLVLAVVMVCLTLLTLPSRAALTGMGRFPQIAAVQVMTTVVVVGGFCVLAAAGALSLATAFCVCSGAFALQAATQVALVRRGTRGAARTATSAEQRREMRAFGGWMQLNGLSELINNQTDRFVVAAVAGVPVVGTYEIANTVARTGRLLPGQYLAALGPEMTSRFSAADDGSMRQQYTRSFKVLACMSLPLVGVLAVCGQPALRLWLGSVPRHAVAVLVLLVLGYAINNLTGPASAWVRAVGRPGLETSYGALQTVLNISLTVPAGLWFGLVGVVAATSIAATVASLYFLVVFHRATRVPFAADLAAWLVRLVTVIGLATAAALLATQALSPASRTAAAGQAGLGATAFALVLVLGSLALRVDPLDRVLEQARGRWARKG